jgi:hypothetical protein
MVEALSMGMIGRITRIAAALVLGGIVGAAMAGCEQPEAQIRSERRNQHMRDTIRTLERREAQSPQKLAATWDEFERRQERDVQRNAENPELIRSAWQRDVDRWNEYQPVYDAEIDKQLRGDPERIDEIWPRLLY